MKYRTQISMRRLGWLDKSCTGRRAHFVNFNNALSVSILRAIHTQ